MSEVNYYLKSPDAGGNCLIFLQYKYKGRRLVFSFGESIRPDKWNKKKQRVKSNAETTADKRHILNELLDNLRDLVHETYNAEIKTGIPEPEAIKSKLQAFLNQNSREAVPEGMTLHGLIGRFISGEIKHKGKNKSANTIKTYKTCQGHLRGYEKKKLKGQALTFADITLSFYYSFISYLEGEKLSVNSIAKNIQVLKVFLSEAVDLGLTANLQFKHKKFSVSREDTDAVYLSENEIINLLQYDLSHNKALEEVRDLFVFGCFVGLRYSDYSNVKPENIVNIGGELFIKIVTQKTKDLVIIPCNPIVLQIFDKYKDRPNKLPKAYANQTFNSYIKDVMKEAEFTERGRLSTAPELELWQCVSSHTARRSFATNYYLQGFPTIDLMKITGHKTEKSFHRYIKATKLETAQRLSKHIKKNWTPLLVKAAS